MFLVGNKDCCTLLSWQSERLKTIARNSLAAEAVVMLNGLEATLYFRAIERNV